MLLCVGTGAFYLFRDPTLLLMLKEKYGTKDVVQYPNKDRDAQAGLKKESALAIDKASQFLLSLNTQGHWQDHPGITALCLRSLTETPQLVEKNDKMIEKTKNWLLNLQGEDGSFYISFSLSGQMKNYTTALAILALNNFDDAESKGAIKKAQEYLVRAQKDESEGYQSSDPEFGGLGYGPGKGADLSNLQLALEALKKIRS